MTWLTVRQFAEKQNKRPVTIYKWINDGFILSLGFHLVRDVTGHWQIGVPREHPSYLNFNLDTVRDQISL